MNIKELFGKDYDTFSEIDPFNPQNKVEGYISRASTEYYGALVITNINDMKIRPQLVMGTPKMHYPFNSLPDGTRKYSFPTAKEIEIYEKLDGTNILAFQYFDHIRRFVSYKTRLRPFLNPESRWGNFFAMWKEVAGEVMSEIEKIVKTERINLSFELYGARNPHLVIYKAPLDFALLFGVTNTGRIISPTKLNGTEKLKPLSPMKVIDRDYVWNYEQLQKELNDGLKEIEDNKYAGVEGTVWYLHLPDRRCIQLKCKPEIIEAIHFSAGMKNINKQVILATCWNALENTEILTVDFIKQLLLEEFRPEIIEASHYQIEKCIDIVNDALVFRNAVLSEYSKLGMNINLQKSEVMRALSSKFNKDDMRKVYSTIVNFG